MIKAVLIDDEKSAIANLENAINFIGNIEILAKETSPEKAVQSVIRLNPELIFLDVEMPRYSGFEVLNKIHEKDIYPKVIFVTGYNQYAIKAIKSQAFDYLLKPVDYDELKETINRFEILIHQVYDNPKNVTSFNEIYLKGLTEREKDILHLILQGKSSNEIAETLFLSKFTIDTHRKNILRKTNTSNMKKLIAILTGNNFLL
jgi:two-component system LytT family response regulator